MLRRTGPVARQRIEGKIATIWRSVLDADDIMQVTYMEAFLRISSFQHRPNDPAGSFLAWISHIAENNLRDAIRELERAKRPNPRRRVQSPGTGDESYVALVELLGATMTTPSLHAQQGEIRSALDCALDRLPPDYAKVVRECDLRGIPAPEVAKAIGKSPGAVYMMIARAHDRLRDILGSESRFFSAAPR